MLETVVYISSASPDVTDADIEEILAACRRHNTAASVTGVLYYWDGSFIQVLEGETAQLDDILKKIKRDDRHRGIIEMYRGQIESRAFGEWAMAYPQGVAEGAVDIRQAALRDALGKDAESTVQILLANFVRVIDRHAVAS